MAPEDVALADTVLAADPKTALDFGSTMPADPRFQVLRCLGVGGMGVVYEAMDLLHHRLVALKTLRGFSAEALYRFKREFRALQHLVVPNLIRYGELFESAGQWFFTMELLAGHDFVRHTRPGGVLDEGACGPGWGSSCARCYRTSRSS